MLFFLTKEDSNEKNKDKKHDKYYIFYKGNNICMFFAVIKMFTASHFCFQNTRKEIE